MTHRYTTTYSTGPFDIQSLLTTAVIENHLKAEYIYESEYIDALCAAAWDRVETHLGVRYAAYTLDWEGYQYGNVFTLPVDASRLEGDVSVQYWNGSEYEDSILVYTNGIGYPVTVCVDKDDDALNNFDADGTRVYMKASCTVSEVTPPASVQQAFLLYLGYLYEKREAVITGTYATEMPLAYQYMLNPYRVSNLR